MSWMFAFSKLDRSTSKDFSPPATPLFSFSTQTFSFAIGGNPDTCFWEYDEENSTGWAVVGIGITSLNGRSAVLTKVEWQQLLTRDSFDLNLLDGHFVAVRWNTDRLECYVDQLGLRMLYFGTCNEGICISTRLDWIARARKSGEIDFESLGGRWLLFNQLSYDSCLAGIERLGPGGRVTIKGGCVTTFTASQPWLPSFEPAASEAAVQALDGLTNCALEYPGGLSLGLSGGLDSRLLLALLMSTPGRNFATHTFGEPGDPDVRVPEQLAALLHMSHHHFNEVPDEQACLSGIASFAAQMNLTEPCTSFHKLRYYSKLKSFCRLMIDGGFGEIGRRQYFNRVVRFGKSAIREKNYSRLQQLLAGHRAHMFAGETSMLLERGARRSLEKVFDEMPHVEKIGIENFVDLLAARTRVPNYGASSQARLDGEILSFMPLAQPTFLRAVFGLPVALRRNGRFYYDLIRSRNPELARFPLVKGGFTYRFGMSTNSVWLGIKIKSRFREPFCDTGPHQLLRRIQGYVLDLVHSKSTTENPIYDSRRVIETVSQYYQGDTRLVGEVGWWLTFELWKQSMVNPQPVLSSVSTSPKSSS